MMNSEITVFYKSKFEKIKEIFMNVPEMDRAVKPGKNFEFGLKWMCDNNVDLILSTDKKVDVGQIYFDTDIKRIAIVPHMDIFNLANLRKAKIIELEKNKKQVLIGEFFNSQKKCFM